MADKLVALLGPGKGPRLFTGRMKNLVIKIQSLTDGQVLITSDTGTITIVASSEPSGEVPIQDSDWIQCTHEGKSKGLMCTIHSKANALHTAGSGTSAADQ